MIVKLIIASIALMGIAFVFFAINILFKKKGKFPNSHIGGNKHLAQRGIACATTQDREAQKLRVVKVKPLETDHDAESTTTSC
jgi:hypothetical protein